MTAANWLKPRTIGFIIANLLFLVQGIVGYGRHRFLPHRRRLHISDRAYDFWVKFILTQTPYIFYGGLASFLCLHLAGQLSVKKYQTQ